MGQARASRPVDEEKVKGLITRTESEVDFGGLVPRLTVDVVPIARVKKGDIGIQLYCQDVCAARGNA